MNNMENTGKAKALRDLKEAYLRLVHIEINGTESSKENSYLYEKTLTPGQRVVLGALKDKSSINTHTFTQTYLRGLVGFTNKGIVEMLEGLAEQGYVKRGIKAGSWSLA